MGSEGVADDIPDIVAGRWSGCLSDAWLGFAVCVMRDGERVTEGE